MNLGRFKYWFFEYHWLILFILVLVAFILWYWIPDLHSSTFLGSAVGGAIALSYFAMKQHLDEIRLFGELLSKFNTRYNEMNKQLYELLGDLDESREPTSDEKAFLYDYFNLCAEEYLYHRKGFIYPEVWYAWVNGMRIVFVNQQIQKLWYEELDTGSYYGLSRELWAKELETASHFGLKSKVLT